MKLKESAVNIKKTISRIFLPLVLSAALIAPATAQVGNQFDLGDIIGIGNNGGYRNGGINTGAILGVANILYQISQQNRNNGYPYPGQYPQNYPYPGQYPQNYPNTYPNGYPYPGQYPQTYPNGYPYPNQYPQNYPNYPYQY